MLICNNGRRSLPAATVTRILPAHEKAARIHRRAKPLHSLQRPGKPKVHP